jgi:Mrp family chromosome partitioning ATPase
MSTKFSLFPAATTAALGDEVVGPQGGVDKRYTLGLLASLIGVAKYVVNIGDATNVQFTVNHAFGTRNVKVTVYRNATPWDDVIVDVARPDVNNVTVTFSTAPAVNQFTVVVWA